MNRGKFAYDHPDDALRALADRLAPSTETAKLSIDDCNGRILASDIIADRDSPAADVSAMDGYALAMTDVSDDSLIPVNGESTPGSQPPEKQAGAALRIFTGAIVPHGCDCVIKREDTEELTGAIRLCAIALAATVGENIRRAGENARARTSVLVAGTRIQAAQLATMANFGCASTEVYRPVKVAIITTGDEVRSVAATNPQPWELRNSNRSSLAGVLSGRQWIDHHRSEHAVDDRGGLTETLNDCLSNSDAVLLTGGVSMGDYDYVPDVIGDLGGEVIFHGLPIRPGKPILGAATGSGKLILGLPGNPVSATIGCRRMALPLLAKLSGQTDWLRPNPSVLLRSGGDKQIPLHWLRLVRLVESGIAEAVRSQGSGDLVSLGQSTGFDELPPNTDGEGPWPYFSWD